jgi:hypothetical protein
MGSRFNKIRASFAAASSIREEVTISSIEMGSDGTKAVVKGKSSLLFTEKGQSRQSNSTLSFLVTKSTGVWTISDVQ